MPHISLAAEHIGTVWGFPVTNALVTMWLVMIVLTTMAWLATRHVRSIPLPLQSAAEQIVGGLYEFYSSITGSHTRQFFPLIATLFLFIITANWIGLLPGVGTIGFRLTDADHGVASETIIPLFRGATADINTTLALALVAVVAIQYYGFKTVGSHYSSRFLNVANPINFFVGILELVSEISKVISFAFRLFGNIFAGEVLLTIAALLMPFVAPLPFLALELFVGFIQALVFSMLTAVFLNIAVSHGEHEARHKKQT